MFEQIIMTAVMNNILCRFLPKELQVQFDAAIGAIINLLNSHYIYAEKDQEVRNKRIADVRKIQVSLNAKIFAAIELEWNNNPVEGYDLPSFIDKMMSVGKFQESSEQLVATMGGDPSMVRVIMDYFIKRQQECEQKLYLPVNNVNRVFEQEMQVQFTTNTVGIA